MIIEAFKQKITKDNSRDNGMAMVLLMLVFYFVWKQQAFVVAALALQVVTMTAPGLFKPVAVVWLGATHVIGAIVSRVLLTIVFFVVVTPMAFIRARLGKDSLKLRRFKTGDESVMWERNHTFRAGDIVKPY